MAPIVRRERPGGMRRGVGGGRDEVPDFASYASSTSRSKEMHRISHPHPVTPVAGSSDTDGHHDRASPIDTSGGWAYQPVGGLRLSPCHGLRPKAPVISSNWVHFRQIARSLGMGRAVSMGRPHLLRPLTADCTCRRVGGSSAGIRP